MNQEPGAEPDKDVEAILSDLDSILSGLNPLSSLPPEAPAPASGPPALVSGSALVLPPSQAAPPPAQKAAPPPPPPPPPKIDVAPPAAAPAPVVLPPPPPPPQPKAALPPAPVVTFDVAAPAPLPPPEAASGQPLGIELSPRGGFVAPAAPKPAPAPERPKPAPFVERVPVELDLPVAPAQTPKPLPAAEPPKPAPAPPPKPAPVAATPAVVPASTAIPEGTPKDQIRRVAFLYAESQQASMAEFMKFLDSVALKVSKRPMFLHRVHVGAVREGEHPKTLLDRVRDAGGAGAVTILASLPDSWIREVEETFAEEDVFLRNVAPEEIAKRSTAVDLLVDLMLLPP
ncbi:MAG: hypothetical protein HY554_11610 [Elusimicrobia bacterium]|nr:hypothetical protein [Elusimicrobiota bacterium]